MNRKFETTRKPGHARMLAASWLVAAMAATVTMGGCVAEPTEGEDGVELGDDALLQGVPNSGLWKTKTITYCFPTPNLAQMPSSVKNVVPTQSALLTRWRSRIQEYVWGINQTWGSAGVLTLKWQETCGSGMVPVSYSTNTPTGGYAVLGASAALSDGVHMDSEFLGNTYATGHNNYHTFVAAHEFGHILGFEHEQDQANSPCKDSQDFSGAGIKLTAYDPNSIMNYCNNQSTQLTALDKQGFAKAYAFLNTDQCPNDPQKTQPGICGCGKSEPTNTANYHDAQGYACSDWQGYDCKTAVSQYGYTSAQQADLIGHCGASCNICK